MNSASTRILNEITDNRDEELTGFWYGKAPCWRMCNCPDSIMKQCPAFKNMTRPCWELEGTYLKICQGDNGHVDIKSCRSCRVYKRHGLGKPIEMKRHDMAHDFLRNKRAGTPCQTHARYLPYFFQNLFERLQQQVTAIVSSRLYTIIERR